MNEYTPSVFVVATVASSASVTTTDVTVKPTLASTLNVTFEPTSRASGSPTIETDAVYVSATVAAYV